MPFFGSRNTSASRWQFDLPKWGSLQTSLRYSLFLGKNFDLPETDQQEGVAHACYVPAPVARENFRPREPVQMQQHGLAWFSRSATRHWFDRSRWAISHLMQRGYSFQETAGCWRVCFRFLLQSNLLPNISDGLYGLFLLFCWLVRCGNCDSRLRTFLVSATMLQISIMPSFVHHHQQRSFAGLLCWQDWSCNLLDERPSFLMESWEVAR